MDRYKPFPPHPEQCLVFYPRGAEITGFNNEGSPYIRSRSFLTGQFTKRLNRRSLEDEFLMIVVAFKPGVLHRLTGIPFSLLINREVELEAIYPRKARELNERLANSGTYLEMISLIEGFLLDLTGSPKLETRKSDGIFEFITGNTCPNRLSWLAREACLSTRQLERKSHDYIGVSPKYFARIARFNQAYYMSLEQFCPDWLDVALKCGYHDYQHLVRDYKEFTGTRPRKFMLEEYRTLERALNLN